MKRFLDFLVKTLTSGSTVSSKRFITLAAFTVMAIGFFGNMLFGLIIEQYIYESMQWIVMVGIGATASEAFATKPKVDVAAKPPVTPNPVTPPDEPVIN